MRKAALQKAVQSGSSFFTLIELLVVISVIAVLCSLLLPALNSARDTSKKIACASNLKQLGVGMNLYATDFDGFLPQVSVSGDACWDAQIADYVNYKHDGDRSSWGPPIYHCPAGAPNPFYPIGNSRGYAMNYYVANMSSGMFASGMNRLGGGKNNSSLMLLIDMWVDVYDNFAEHYTFGNSANYEYIDIPKPTYVGFRHSGVTQCNFVRADGSVAASQKGSSGMGKDIVWIYYSDSNAYAYYQDGPVPR